MLRNELIEKFYRGECTEEEIQVLLEAFGNPQKGERTVEALWEEFSSTTIAPDRQSEQMFAALQQKIRAREMPRSRHRWPQSQWLRVAAILVLAFSLSLLVSRENTHSLLLSSSVNYITQKNPAGQKSHIRLPDGTQVHLNAESSITYPEVFTDSTRSVCLIGEAFFEVTENPEKPFIVSASGVDTRALGTSFNVKAYAQDFNLNVVLVSGKVSVTQTNMPSKQGKILQPGEEAIVDTKTYEMRKQPAELHRALAWKNNILLFQQATASQVFTELERWYGVKFVHPPLHTAALDSWRFTGEFENASLENVLMSISYVKSFKYTIDHNTITITP